MGRRRRRFAVPPIFRALPPGNSADHHHDRGSANGEPLRPGLLGSRRSAGDSRGMFGRSSVSDLHHAQTRWTARLRRTRLDQGRSRFSWGQLWPKGRRMSTADAMVTVHINRKGRSGGCGHRTDEQGQELVEGVEATRLPGSKQTGQTQTGLATGTATSPTTDLALHHQRT